MRKKRLAMAVGLFVAFLLYCFLKGEDSSEPRLPLTALQTFANYSNFTEERVPIGGRRIGFGMTSEYRMTTPWRTAAPRLREELTKLGFVPSPGSSPNRTEWDRPDLHVSVREVPRPQTGAPTFLVRLTRPGTSQERLRDLYLEWRYRLRL